MNTFVVATPDAAAASTAQSDALSEVLLAAANVYSDGPFDCLESNSSADVDSPPRHPIQSSSRAVIPEESTSSEPQRQAPPHPSLDSILKNSSTRTFDDRNFRSRPPSKRSVRRQLSFGRTDTVEFDASLPACFAVEKPVTRWRSTRGVLERSHSSDCLPRIPSREDNGTRAGSRRYPRRQPEASPRMPRRIPTSDDSFSCLSPVLDLSESIDLSPVRPVRIPEASCGTSSILASPPASPPSRSPPRPTFLRMESSLL